jgi:PhnB protein
VAEREGLRPGVQAQLSVRQGRAAVEFYKAAFGATELYRFGGDDANDEIVAQLAVGHGAFWVQVRWHDCVLDGVPQDSPA